MQNKFRLVFMVISAALMLMPTRVNAAATTLFCEENSVFYASCDECSNSSAATSGAAAASATANSIGSGTGEGGGCGNNANGDQANKDQVWGYLVNKFTQAGYSKDEAEKAAAGIMGNWQQESAFNSYRSDGSGCSGAAGPITGSAGTGIAQWCGSRQQDLADFAAERGKDWTCLGAQLEFTWQEMEERDLVTKMKGLSPAQASQTFDEIFEVSDGSGERQKKGEEVYTEYTGKDPGSLGANSSSNQSSQCEKNTGKSSSGAIPGETCAESQKATLEAISSGRIVLGNADGQQHDIDNCSDAPIGCNEGVRGKTLRGTMAAANSSGVDSLTLTALNEDHDCDSGDHPHGLATDIGAVNGQRCDTNSEACDQLFQYLIDHQEELDIRWLIYNGSGCQQSVAGHENFSECRGDHSDHIHVSYNE